MDMEKTNREAEEMLTEEEAVNVLNQFNLALDVTKIISKALEPITNGCVMMSIICMALDEWQVRNHSTVDEVNKLLKIAVDARLGVHEALGEAVIA